MSLLFQLKITNQSDSQMTDEMLETAALQFSGRIREFLKDVMLKDDGLPRVSETLNQKQPLCFDYIIPVISDEELKLLNDRIAQADGNELISLGIPED